MTTTLLVSPQAAAVARLTASRLRLRHVLIEKPSTSGAAALLQSLVQRHPGLSATLSLLVGAALTRLRPWRWLQQATLWRALGPTLVALLAQAPRGSWSTLLDMLLRHAAGPLDEPPDAPPGTASDAAADGAPGTPSDTAKAGAVPPMPTAAVD